MKNLIVITTIGNINLLEGSLISLSDETNDIVIIDDGSKMDYKDLRNKYNFTLIKQERGKGLTNSWNIAYCIFKDGYEKCLISNDDVIFPNKVPEDMWRGLDKYTLIGPLSDPIGCGKFAGRFQDVTHYLSGIEDFKNVMDIQNRLQKKHPNKRFLEIGKDITLPREEPPYINGFCFSFNRNIIDSEFSKDILFNPIKINTGNEKELQKHRLKEKKAISIKSYVYHYKGQSLNSNSNRQEIINK